MDKLIIVRHATTTGIENHLLQGSTDSPLSRQGIHQAEETALAFKDLPIHFCYSSPSGRAMLTAEIICKPLGIKPVVWDDLREMSFGLLENGQYYDIPSQYTGFIHKIQALGKFLLANTSGESIYHLRRRAERVWQRLLKLNQPGANLIVSHGVFIHELISTIFKHTDVLKHRPFTVDACGITVIEIREDEPYLILLNDTSHLKSLDHS